MDYIPAGPRDRIIAPDADGTFYRAGDRKRRRLLKEFERAQTEQARNDPAQIARRAKEIEDAVRGRLSSAVSEAMGAVDRVKALRVQLAADRDEARTSAMNLRDAAEAAAALAEADAHDRRLRQLPATIDKAKSALKDARDALARHDAAVAARAADRAAGAEQRKAAAEREASARAAAEELYRSLMAEPTPKPVILKGQTK